MSPEDGLGLAVGRVPDPYRVVLTARGNVFAVRAVGHTGDGALVPLQTALLLAGVQVPDPHRPVVAGRGRVSAVGAVRHAVDPAGVAAQRAFRPAGDGVPSPHRPVVAARDEGFAVRAVRHAPDGPIVAEEREEAAFVPPPKVVPFPVAQPRRTLIEQIAGAVRVVVRPLPVRQAEGVPVQVRFGLRSSSWARSFWVSASARAAAARASAAFACRSASRAACSAVTASWRRLSVRCCSWPISRVLTPSAAAAVSNTATAPATAAVRRRAQRASRAPSGS